MRVCWQQREKKNADAADVLFSIFFPWNFSEAKYGRRRMILSTFPSLHFIEQEDIVSTMIEAARIIYI